MVVPSPVDKSVPRPPRDVQPVRDVSAARWYRDIVVTVVQAK
jgi:hypothetical protein